MLSEKIEKQLTIQGMSCQGCVKKVHKILSADPGLENIQVELNPGRAHFTCTQDTNNNALIQSLAAHDFIANEDPTGH